MDNPTSPSYTPTPAPAPAPVQTPPPSVPPARTSSSKHVLWIVLAVLVVLAGAAYAWMQLNPATPTESPSPSPTTTATADPTAGWKTYSNTQYSFEIKYPPSWQVSNAIESAIVLFYDSAAPLIPETDVPFNGVIIRSTTGLASGSATTISGNSGLTTGWQGVEFGGGFLKENFILSSPGITILQRALTSEVQPLEDQILSTFRFTSQAATQYLLKCGGSDVGGSNAFGQQFSWYTKFSSQIEAGWELGTLCYNQALNQVVYVKSRDDISRPGFFFAQLGVYDIAADTFVKADVIQPGYFGGCSLDNSNSKWVGPVVTYSCASGDAGVSSTDTYTYNTDTKQTKKIRECISQEPNPEVCKDL